MNLRGGIEYRLLGLVGNQIELGETPSCSRKPCIDRAAYTVDIFEPENAGYFPVEFRAVLNFTAQLHCLVGHDRQTALMDLHMIS